MKLESSRIILTGAASGIGFALLKRLAGIPCQVVAADLNEEALKTAVGKLISPAAKITPFVGDMGDPQAVDLLFSQAVSAMGGIDLFIANAGFAYYESLGTISWEHIDKIFRVNTVSPIYAVTKMTALHEDGSPYLVAITASAMAKLGLAGFSLYGATKAALDRFADAYHLEQPANAHLMMVYPIATRTNFFKAASSKAAPVLAPSQTPDYLAGKILRGIEKESRSVQPSILFRLMMLVNRVLPITGIYQHYSRRLFESWLQRQ